MGQASCYDIIVIACTGANMVIFSFDVFAMPNVEFNLHLK